MCRSGPKWKREVVQDHKFDFIDTRDYHSKAFSFRAMYLWVYILVIKSFFVYIADIYTATTMLTSEKWSNKIFESCTDKDGCVPIRFDVAKWLFVGCIIFSFLLLAYEGRKARKIIKSRDISFAFTNIKAQNYYNLRSYDHFCFFSHIEDSTKKKDDFAFFIFFTFKGWKRLLLADGPRQTINALTLYSFYKAKSSQPGDWYQPSKYFDREDMVTNILLVTMVFTVLIFAGSLFLLILAAVCYVPLLCYIRGNLKEYCCHKVDKRIAELIKRKQKQRLARVQQLAKKEAAGDFSHRTDKNGVVHNAPQPTLPNISLDDDDDTTRKYANSVRTGNDSYWAADYKDDHYGHGADYPPMPGYDPNAYPPQPGYANTGYTPSLHGDDSTLYDHETNKYGYAKGNDAYHGQADSYAANGAYNAQQDQYQQYQQGYGNTGYDQNAGYNYGYQEAPDRQPSRNDQRGWSNDRNQGGNYYNGGHAL